ncbi:AAA domain-containing protein [Amylostereum chailletii]|nr:AAA domain-containing protein [Amylostereum chailletii]
MSRSPPCSSLDDDAALNVTAIYIVGPSSTGKTTLCNALAAQLGLAPNLHISEVARTVMKEQGFSRATVGSLAMQRAIVQAQVVHDRDARQNAIKPFNSLVAGVGGRRGVVLCDRSAVDAVVYSALSGEEGDAQTLIASEEFQSVLPAYRSPRATFVLLGPISNWLFDDGIRSLEDGARCHAMFKKILGELGIPFMDMGENCRWLEERVAFVRRCVWL